MRRKVANSIRSVVVCCQKWGSARNSSHSLPSEELSLESAEKIRNYGLSIRTKLNGNPVIYITQLIYVNEGQEAVFDEFEEIAIPSILRYNGRLLVRLRPDQDAFVESHIERPYEIHLVEFDSEKDFEAFKLDKRREQFLHLKEKSVRSSILIQGVKL